ncbi:NAD(P)-dependent oxidoreductase [Actimicrobium antarcticum]|uniref:NAD(P)-dependent oxidoreductase n=1 Tax=Actimicrobium antarcticum TaxID=1051899 RepID=A0ABP7TYY2_9BURK
MSTAHIGFLGLGSMGAPMARNLLDSGLAVTVYNRTRSVAEAFGSAGASASIAETPAGAVVEGGIAITMLANDAALEDVTLGPDGILQQLGKGGLHISMSTVSPETSKKLAALHAERGSLFLSAPVFGRPEAAAAKKLWICQSGSNAAKQRAKAILDILGQGIHDFGEDPGAANVVKLSGNFMILAAIETMAEAQALAEKNGIDRTMLANFFGQTIFSCPIYQNYGRTLAERAFEPAGFKLELGMKDVRLVRDVAEASMVPMPLADLLHARLLTSLAKKRGKQDWTAIELVTAEDAALR